MLNIQHKNFNKKLLLTQTFFTGRKIIFCQYTPSIY